MKLFSISSICIIFFSACTTTNINTPERIQQVCTATPINSSESHEKQCCLKDTLETKLKRLEELCSTKESKDSISNSASDNISITSSVPLDFRKKNDIHGRFDYQRKEANDSREGCFGANCQVNNIYIASVNKKDFSKNISDYCQSLNKYLIEEKYLLLTCVLLCALLISSIIVSTKSFKFLSKIYGIKRIYKIPRKFHDLNSFIYLFLKKLFLNFKKYNILSPTKYAEGLTSDCETFNQLKFAIVDDNPEIRNVAITGPYGSGKSSVWKTFCRETKLSKLKNIVEISLAKFNDPNEDKQTFSELEIERAIIQQFVFSKKYTDLKYSKFPRIKNLTDLKTSFIAIILVTFVFLILPLTNNTISCILKSWQENPFGREMIYVPIGMLILYILICYAIQIINSIRISKICLKDIEITLGENESLFNRCINEIVYFFEATKCNCVVIEDLDRFESLKIFSKLRELNNLINNYPATKNVVKFIYLVRDEILTGHERTKFFDFIIPVVPILNGDDEAVEYIKNHYLRQHCFDCGDERPYLRESYLQEIKPYLNDLRLIKNCFNELDIYKELNPRQEHGEYGDEKIFSLILYKNKYPKDFQNMQRKKGVLYYCLNQLLIDFSKGDSIDRVSYFSDIQS